MPLKRLLQRSSAKCVKRAHWLLHTQHRHSGGPCKGPLDTDHRELGSFRRPDGLVPLSSAVKSALRTATDSSLPTTPSNLLRPCLAQCQGRHSWSWTAAVCPSQKVWWGWVQSAWKKAPSRGPRCAGCGSMALLPRVHEDGAFPPRPHGGLAVCRPHRPLLGSICRGHLDGLGVTMRGSSKQGVDGRLALFQRQLLLSSALYRTLSLIYTLLPANKPKSPKSSWILN